MNFKEKIHEATKDIVLQEFSDKINQNKGKLTEKEIRAFMKDILNEMSEISVETLMGTLDFFLDHVEKAKGEEK